MKDEFGIEMYPGEDEFDWDQDDEDINTGSREFLIAVQPYLRHDATMIGNFLTCKLPKCRRMKRCTGRHPMERLALPDDHWSIFPPCVDCDEKQAALIRQGRRRLAEWGEPLD